MAIRNNGAILEYCRTSVSALSGGTAGILGLTGLYGFAFYFIISFMITVSTCERELRKKYSLFSFKTFQWFLLYCYDLNEYGIYICKQQFYYGMIICTMYITMRCALLQIMLLLKAGSSWQRYFRSRTVLFSNGLMGGLFVSLHKVYFRNQ